MTEENHPHRITERVTISRASDLHGVIGRRSQEVVAGDPAALTPRGGPTRRAALGHLVGGMVALVGTVRHDTTQAQAMTASQGEAPNHIELTGGETQITYDAPTAGGLQLIYAGPYGHHTLKADQLRSEVTALGRLVAGSLRAFPDQGELWLSLLLPRFTAMTSEDAPEPFATVAILKWVISTIAGPPRTGALEEYRVITLEGTAQGI